MSSLPRPLKWPPIFPLEKGLVLWLPFDDRSGAVAYDRSGKRNHGTLYGPTWIAGRRGGALSFDGINDYVNVAQSSSLELTGGLTVVAWVEWSSLQSGSREIMSKYGGNYKGYRLYEDENHRPAFQLATTIGGDQVFTVIFPTAFSVNVWYHVVGVWDGSQINIYVNGVGTTPVAAPSIENSGPLQIAKTSWWTDYSNATIDEVRIYNRDLNAAEIKRHAESELMLVRH